MASESKDKGSWAIGGCTLIGLGVGLVYLQANVLWFVASILIGIGAGLLVSALLSSLRKNPP